MENERYLKFFSSSHYSLHHIKVILDLLLKWRYSTDIETTVIIYNKALLYQIRIITSIKSENQEIRQTLSNLEWLHSIFCKKNRLKNIIPKIKVTLYGNNDF